MQADDIRLLYEYNEWANGRILAAAAGLAPEQFRQTSPHTHRDLRYTLVHALDAEYGWRLLCQHSQSAPLIDPDDFENVAALTTRWEEEMGAWRDYVGALTDTDLQGTIRYKTDSGQERERLLWPCLYHVVNHGTQHRSEAAAMLTEYGHSPGDLDFTVFLSQRG